MWCTCLRVCLLLLGTVDVVDIGGVVVGLAVVGVVGAAAVVVVVVCAHIQAYHSMQTIMLNVQQPAAAYACIAATVLPVLVPQMPSAICGATADSTYVVSHCNVLSRLHPPP
jgi:hypothetical protein